MYSDINDENLYNATCLRGLDKADHTHTLCMLACGPPDQQLECLVAVTVVEWCGERWGGQRRGGEQQRKSNRGRTGRSCRTMKQICMPKKQRKIETRIRNNGKVPKIKMYYVVISFNQSIQE